MNANNANIQNVNPQNNQYVMMNQRGDHGWNQRGSRQPDAASISSNTEQILEQYQQDLLNDKEMFDDAFY